MTFRTLFFLQVCLCIFATNARCRSQTILLDNFSDPGLLDWTFFETYSEKPWGPGTLEVVDGELFYGTGGAIPAGSSCDILETGFAVNDWTASATDPTFTNGTLSAKVRSETVGDATETGNIAMYVRGDLTTLTAYLAAARGSDHALGLFKFVNGEATDSWLIEDLNFTTNEDWFMEVGAIGDEISMKVWKAGATEPQLPQLSIIDADIATGTVGLTAAMAPCIATEPLFLRTYYDDVTFTVPEPSAGLICFTAVGFGMRVRRRGRS